MEQYVISIGRQFGSGGRKIGQILAEKLEIPCYDKHLIEEAAECSGMEKEQLEKADEMTVNRFFYSIPSQANRFTGYGKPVTDTLYVIQSELIRQYAEQGSCIIIGRCADRVLENRRNLLSVFIYAPLEARIEELKKRYETDHEEALYLIKQADKIRKNYYNYYTGKKWGEKSSYDLMIDSSRFSADEVAEIIKSVVQRKVN